MNIVNLDQDTDEWLEWRNTGIGASDAAVILGESPYQTAYGLWCIKTGRAEAPDLSKNPNVQRGNRLEPIARKVAEKYIGKSLEPLCASEQVEGFILTSFDGITADRKTVCELKCPHPTTFADVEANSRESKAYKLYWIQCQQQLLVSKADVAFLVFYSKGDGGYKDKIIPFKVFPDLKFQKEVLIPKLRYFWECIQTDTPPEKDPKRDPCDVDDKSWLELAQDYHPIKQEALKLKRELKALDEQLKPYENRFIDLMDDNYRADQYGVKISRSDRAQPVNQDTLIDELLTILKAKGIPINKQALIAKHRKGAAKPSYRFTVSGGVDLPPVSTNDDTDVVSWF